MPEEQPEITTIQRVIFPEQARQIIQQKDDEIAELKKKLEEMTKALASEANQHGGTAREKDEALVKAGKDPLTELPNRDLGRERAEGLLNLAARGEIKLALVRLDIDNFKQINDAYGHLWGDKVLISVARKLDETKRNIDTASRYGGEEFDLVIPFKSDTHLEDIAKVIVRHLTSLYDIPKINPDSGDPPEKLTGSFGVAIVNSGEKYDYETVSQMADDALYAAKNGGRNQIKIIETHDRNISKNQRVYFQPPFSNETLPHSDSLT